MFTQFIPACLDAHKTFVLTKSHPNLLILASGEIETEFWALFHAVDAFVDFAHSSEGVCLRRLCPSHTSSIQFIVSIIIIRLNKLSNYSSKCKITFALLSRLDASTDL